jgi:hypothetical protein
MKDITRIAIEKIEERTESECSQQPEFRGKKTAYLFILYTA